MIELRRGDLVRQAPGAEDTCVEIFVGADRRKGWLGMVFDAIPPLGEGNTAQHRWKLKFLVLSPFTGERTCWLSEREIPVLIEAVR